MVESKCPKLLVRQTQCSFINGVPSPLTTLLILFFTQGKRFIYRVAHESRYYGKHSAIKSTKPCAVRIQMISKHAQWYGVDFLIHSRPLIVVNISKHNSPCLIKRENSEPLLVSHNMTQTVVLSA